MADVFSIEEFEDCPEEKNESSNKKMIVKKELDEITEAPQILLNDVPEEVTNELSSGTTSEMTLKEETTESELFEAEDAMVNQDDLLPPVNRLEKYANSEIVFNRQVVARNLLETLRLVHENKDEVARVISVVCCISEDYDPSVRQELMVQLPHITAFCKETDISSQLLQALVPIIINFLGDENNNVRKSCHGTLLSLLEQGFLDVDTVSEKMCPLILHLTDSLHPEDLRIESILLMSKLVFLLGKKAAEEIFLERLFTLCADKSNNIRKACASTFGDISTTCGRKVTEEVLLPKFFSLCEDSTWCVRKACAENFMPVSCMVSKCTRHKELSSFYLILLADHNRWVRMTAFQALGPFISTFAEPDRTGLYYSKDGVLTILDTPYSIDSSLAKDKSNPKLCNGSKSDDLARDISSSDRTSSSISCDSVLPLCDTDQSLSAQEVPGISCHVGNYCTVIEVDSPAVKDEASCDDSDSGKGGSTLGDDYDNEDKPCDAASSVENGILQEDLSGDKGQENCFENSRLQFNNETLDEGISMDAAEDYNSNCENTMQNHRDTLDSRPEETSNTLSSITVNGIDLSSSIASGPTSCDAIPIISCNNSLKEESSKQSSEELQHSASGDDTESEAEVSGSRVLAMFQSLCSLGLDDNDVSAHEIKVKSESSNKECAFNYFQFWRDPIPDIEINVDSITRESRGGWFKEGRGRGVIFRGYDKELTDYISFDIRTPVNKGEPPPGTNTVSPHDQDIVPPELLLQYLNMIDASWAQSIDAEIARHCAYSLPAVALTLGREFWPCLKATFDALSSDLQGFIMMWKVRRTIASAMHQLAVILGPDITSQDLLPVFSRFISDLDEVRIGILQHLYEFLKVLRQEERNKLLPSLSEFLVSNSDSDSNEKNWRFRLILAEQLVSIVNLYDAKHIHKHLVPLTLTLIKDKVCEVRLATVRVMAAVMKQLSLVPVYAKAFISELTENFVHSPKWLYRQLYVYICQQIILEKSLSPNQFAEEALPQLLYLCWDRVPNVRIAIARCLVIVIWPIEVFSNPESPHRELLLQTIHTLQSDIDADVRFYANMVSTHECSCLQNGGFTNGVEPFV